MRVNYSAISCLHATSIAFILLTSSSTLLAAPNRPGWWALRGVTNSQPSDDFAVANLGQLKQFAVKARDELNAALVNQGGAGPEIDALIASFGVNLTQLPGVTPSQSSEAYGGLASRAIDNNTDGNFASAFPSVTHTAGPILDDRSANPNWLNPWWQVDLGAVCTIRNVEVWNRTDSNCGSRLTHFYILVSDAPMPATIPLGTLLASSAVWKSEEITTAPSPSLKVKVGNRLGRYVRIQIAGEQFLHLAEVKVIGVVNTEALPTDDYAGSTLGQLKSIVIPFLDRLKSLHYLKGYPWDGRRNEADDLALANLGQLKQLFSFDLTHDTDGDGVPDILELANGMDPLTSDVGLDTDGDGIPDVWEVTHGMDRHWAGDKLKDLDGDGISNFAEYGSSHTDANDYFNGRPVKIILDSGGGQRALPNHYVAGPIRIRILEANNAPIANAPVQFSAGRGRFARDRTGKKVKADTLYTDNAGYAQIEFFTSSRAGGDLIKVTAGHQSINVPAAVDYNLPPMAPSKVTVATDENGGIHLAWQDNSSDEVSFIVEKSTNTEDWQVFRVLPANSSSVDINYPDNITTFYRVTSSYDPQ